MKAECLVRFLCGGINPRNTTDLSYFLKTPPALKLPIPDRKPQTTDPGHKEKPTENTEARRPTGVGAGLKG